MPGTETLLAGAPRQPGSRVFRRRPAMPGAGTEITEQPAVWRDTGHLQSAEDRIEHARQPRSVHAVRSEREFPADRDSAQAALGSIVVHGNGRVVHEHCQAVAVAQQGVQGRTPRIALGDPGLLREERFGEPREPPLGGRAVRARQTSGIESICGEATFSARGSGSRWLTKSRLAWQYERTPTRASFR